MSSGTESATYSYLANSPLVENITFNQNSNTRMTTTRQYDKLNRLTAITSSPNTQTPSPISYAYAYNAANQRTAVTNTDNSKWVYQYDSLGQVTYGKKFWSDGTIVAGQQFEYTFDDIGNRKTTKSGGDGAGSNLRLATYAPNSVNQYTGRSVPGVADIFGTANASAIVTVNLQPAYRKADYFRKELSVGNGSGPVWLGVTNVGVRNGAGPGGLDIVTTNQGHLLIPRFTESFSYDEDGNLTGDSLWTYTWDGESRLTKVESSAGVPPAAKRKVTWEYDGQGRRVRQTTQDGSSGSWEVTEDLKFVYDGRRCIAELNAANNGPMRSYVWGLDMSGTLDGAGGVAGLLMLNSAVNGAHFYAYDGNGNVAGLVKASDGSLSAEYEYGPFGDLIRATGPMAKENRFRFSTKRSDPTTDFILYEYRIMRTDIAKWLSRDPIEENGGVNLYAMVGNDALNHIDLGGLFRWGTHNRLTRTSLDQFVAVLPKRPSSKCVDKMFRTLRSANIAQDLGEAFNDLRRHFNRAPDLGAGPNQIAYNRLLADLDYRLYLLSENVNFAQLMLEPKCEEALKTAGRMTHSWQDFYAHAISDAFSVPTRRFVLFDAWTLGFGGDPDSHPHLWPSSFPGEHPSGTEPVSGLESQMRQGAAIDFVRGKYDSLLAFWLHECECWCNQ